MEAVQHQDRVRRRLNEILADDRGDAGELLERLRGLRRDEGTRVCSAALHQLAHLELPEEQAERLLEDLLRHRTEVTRLLGRDPGLRVATIDYLSNVKKMLTNPAIVERSQLEQTERSALTDSLTGVYNRRHFGAMLRLELKRSQRYGLALAVLMLDLDEFKRLNDERGHLFGDLVLQRVGHVLRRAVRDADLPCRYGGEEFAVILPETDRLGAYAVAERIRRHIVQRFNDKPVRGEVVAVRLSGGIAAYPEDGTTPEDLVAAADRALYLSKSRGKNQISLYHTERRDAIRFPVKSGARMTLARAGDAAPTRAMPINLSTGGVLLRTDSALPQGAVVSLRLEGRGASGAPRSWLHAGRVVRIDSDERLGPQVAIAFDEPLPGECLEQQVRRCRPTRAREARA